MVSLLYPREYLFLTLISWYLPPPPPPFLLALGYTYQVSLKKLIEY